MFGYKDLKKSINMVSASTQWNLSEVWTKICRIDPKVHELQKKEEAHEKTVIEHKREIEQLKKQRDSMTGDIGRLEQKVRTLEGRTSYLSAEILNIKTELAMKENNRPIGNMTMANLFDAHLSLKDKFYALCNHLKLRPKQISEHYEMEKI